MTNNMPDGVRTTIGWTIGIAIIAIILLIFVIIFGNLSGNIGFTDDSATILNDTITLTDTPTTPSTVDGESGIALTNVIVTNATGGETVPTTNYTISGGTFVASTPEAEGSYNNTPVNISADSTFTSDGELRSEEVILNYSQSAVNTSTQFPTVGTILGVVILLAILIGLLIFVIVKVMGVAGKAGVGSSKNSSFNGSSREFS